MWNIIKKWNLQREINNSMFAKSLLLNNFFIEATRGTGAQSVTVTVKGNIYLFIFSFLHSSVETKPSVEFRHSTRNASRTRRKMGNGVS